MKKLLLFAGLPGVGKSTISRGVSKKPEQKLSILMILKRSTLIHLL